MTIDQTKQKILEACDAARVKGYIISQGYLVHEKLKTCCALGAFVAGEDLEDPYPEACLRAGLPFLRANGFHQGFDGKRVPPGASIEWRRFYDLGREVAQAVGLP